MAAFDLTIIDSLFGTCGNLCPTVSREYSGADEAGLRGLCAYTRTKAAQHHAQTCGSTGHPPHHYRIRYESG